MYSSTFLGARLDLIVILRRRDGSGDLSKNLVDQIHASSTHQQNARVIDTIAQIFSNLLELRK
jgi:hypothetical protein